MALSSLIRVLKVNEARSGTKDGRAWQMQDAECLLLTDSGEVDQVGVLMVPKALQDKVQPGDYMASFALRANMASRRIEAVLVNLTALPPSATKRAAAA